MIDTNTTITMGGDGKSHEIPDELWAFFDHIVNIYRDGEGTKSERIVKALRKTADLTEQIDKEYDWLFRTKRKSEESK